jgi:hypothetical protein
MIESKRHDVVGFLLYRDVWFTIQEADALLIGNR